VAIDNQVVQHFCELSKCEWTAIEAQMARLMAPGIDAADIYFQQSLYESWSLDEGIVKAGSFNVETGVGIRAMQGEKTGFAYTEALSQDAIQRAVTAASSISQQGNVTPPNSVSEVTPSRYYGDADPLLSISNEQKINLLKSLDRYARAKDPRIIQVSASITANHEKVLVYANDGTLATDIRPLVRLNVSVIAEQGGRRESGSAGSGGRYDLGIFVTADSSQVASEVSLSLADEAVEQALINLEAIDAPAGIMPVVLGPGWPGVLLHEAIGHGLEGDFNRKGSSAFSGRIGDKVASSQCTIVDDGTLQDRRGSLNIDDEGTPTQCTTLIENGILKGYMQDKLNARLMGEASTGNGRRESYAHLPMPRMTNTYMLSGKYDHDEIIRSVKRGIYASNFGGGQVDITSGNFVFSANQAYLIEDGKITAPIKGATLIGDGPSVLTKVSMVGNNMALDRGVGVCGKQGQSVPVGVGQPSLKVDELTVGGTSAG
jgi:TldD protein